MANARYRANPPEAEDGDFTDLLTDPKGRIVVLNGGSAVSSDSLIDHSGTISTGGTAQTLMSANDNRNGFQVQNLSSDDLWINELGTATVSQPSIKIPSDALYETPSNLVPKGLISIIGATTGQSFAAREW